jgi:anti-sigma regulatory factor (Ser/Thr protein kinase)
MTRTPSEIIRFQTLQEAHRVSLAVAQRLPNPYAVAQGLSELMINAIEHGNLGITYEEKTRLLLDGTWEAEIKRRLALPENREKYATLEYMAHPHEHVLIIRDQGCGFDWKHYLEFPPERALDPNGRGIAISKSFAFSNIEYQGNGNTVVCRIIK